MVLKRFKHDKTNQQPFVNSRIIHVTKKLLKLKTYWNFFSNLHYSQGGDHP
jgi:hypothetical protein